MGNGHVPGLGWLRDSGAVGTTKRRTRPKRTSERTDAGKAADRCQADSRTRPSISVSLPNLHLHPLTATAHLSGA